jgi:hypothetical protein
MVAAAVGAPKPLYALGLFVLLSNDGVTTPVLKGFDLSWRCSTENR